MGPRAVSRLWIALHLFATHSGGHNGPLPGRLSRRTAGGRLLRLLTWPTRLLRWPPFQRWIGGQMEFVIRKDSTGSPRSPGVRCMDLSHGSTRQ